MKKMINLKMACLLFYRQLNHKYISTRLLILCVFIAVLSHCNTIKNSAITATDSLANISLNQGLDIYSQQDLINPNLSTNKNLISRDFQGKLESLTIDGKSSRNIWGNNCDCR